MKLLIFIFAAILALVFAGKRLPCGYNDECPKGMVCAKKPIGFKRCVVPMKEGGICKRDPFWICDEGLDCIDGTCCKIAGKGESCVGACTMCAPGLICVEKSPIHKRCIKPMPLGAVCKRDPYWQCEDGLVCKKGVCQKKVAKKGQSCVDPKTVCKEGLICVAKSPSRKKCIKLMKIGQMCKRDPWWACEDGLKCVANVCVKDYYA